MTKPVRIAQIGCGYWGKNLARNFAELGVLAAVVDGDPATASAIGTQHSVPVSDFDAVLADPAINGVALATPAVSHAEMAQRALRAGKNVFVEKPLALSPEDAIDVIATAKSAGRILMVGHLLQYHPAFAALRQLVASGGLGQLRYIFSNRMSLGKFRTEENVLWSFAPHDVSMVLALVNGEPTMLSCQGAAYVTPGVADWATLQMQFANGVTCHVQVSWHSPYKEQRLVVIGDDAMAIFDDAEQVWEKKLAIYRHAIDRSGAAPTPIKSDAEYLAVPKGEPLRNECKHFVDCIADDRRPLTDGDEGLRVLRTLHRADIELQKAITGATL
jgi:predicted dehydrogenase